MSLLLAVSNGALATNLIKELSQARYSCDSSYSGKETQQKLSEKRYEYLFLSTDIRNHTFLPVLKYCRINTPGTKIILCFGSKDEQKELDLSDEELKKLGVADFLYHELNFEIIDRYINSQTKFDSWKNIKPVKIEEIDRAPEELNDKIFTKIKIESFYAGNISIFDIFLRIGKNKFLKLQNKGEVFDIERLKKYKSKHNIEYFYFKTNERAVYVNYINSLISKLANSNKLEGGVKTTAVLGGASEKFLEEVYTKGLPQDVYSEGIKLCDNIYANIERSPNLNQIFKQIPKKTQSIQYLTALFTCAVAMNIKWVGEQSTQNLIMGSMLHLIGLLQVSWYDHNSPLSIDQMSKMQLEEYQKYPLHGYDMLTPLHHIPSAVKQIVLQHRECNNKTGFPYGLSYSKIFPMAKIVGLSSYISTRIVIEGKTPLEVMQDFIPDERQTALFEPAYIKAMIKGFIKSG